MKKLNCWELVKLTKRQRRDIKPKRERGENRKNSLDGISLNPKCSHNRKSAAKPRNRKIPLEGSPHKHVEVVSP